MKISSEPLIQEFGRVFMVVHRRLDRAMSAQGASLARTKLLMYIDRHDGQARAADIADLFGQAPRTVTEALDALERDNLIIRTTDPDDRRVKRIAITDEGHRAVAATEPLRRELLSDLCRGLTEEDRQHFYACLMKIGEAADPAYGSASSCA